MSTDDKQIQNEIKSMSSPLKWVGLAILLLMLAWVLLSLLSAYNATGQCLSTLSKLSESEMKLRVVKSLVAHSLEGARLEEKPGRLKIMFLGRSVTQQELIQRNHSGTLLSLLDERPLLLSNEDQLGQFAAKIDAGEFTILNHSPVTTYSLLLLPGKSLYRADPTITAEYFQKIKKIDPKRFNTHPNNFDNYLYGYNVYNLDTACCGGKPLISKEEILDARQKNLERIDSRKKLRWDLPVSNCGAVWFPPSDNNRTNFLFD